MKSSGAPAASSMVTMAGSACSCDAVVSAVAPSASLDIRIRSEIEQEPNHPRAVLRGGMVQGRAMVLVAAHARAKQRRVARDEAAHVVLAIERDRGPEIEPGAMGEEIRRHVLAHAREAGGPAKHAYLVVVARADDIGACFDQERDDVEIRRVGRKVQGIGVVAIVADANVRSAIEQKPHAVRAIAPRRHVQRRPAP